MPGAASRVIRAAGSRSALGGGGGGGVAATAVTLPGTNTNYISTPYHSSWDVLSGDLDLRAYVIPNTWAPSASQPLVSQQNNAGGQRRFNFTIGNGGASNGQLMLQWTDASNVSQGGSSNGASTASTGFTAATGHGVRVTLELNVAGVYNVKFYTRSDASIDLNTGWTQLGTTKVGAAATTLHGSTAPVSLGSSIGDTTNGSGVWAGNYVKALVLNGVAGTVVGGFDATAATRTATRTPSTYTDPQSHIWTPNGTGWDWSTT